jgi:hypothetical protein
MKREIEEKLEDIDQRAISVEERLLVELRGIGNIEKSMEGQKDE